jgi:hypothetical protein
MLAKPAKHTEDLRLLHYLAAPAALQQEQQYYTRRKPDHYLYHRAIHDIVSFL